MATAAGPQTLGRYQIERVLGKGAMGVVYEALDPKLHRKVAIKTILVSQLDEETAKDFSMRFVREAHAVARLNHPNIVQVYDFGEEGGVAYFVMEFIRGKELKSELAANQAYDRNETVRIMCELLDALDFAHEAGVIHRDIKPANVMLDSQGRAKLADFGVARLTDNERTSAERTQAGTMVGTPAYMSPEQIQGMRVDRRTDIFSAGIILYQFLTGQKPFTGEGAWTVAKKIIQDNPPSPSSLNVSVSPEFDRVVAKALAKLPDERFSSAREFAAALKRAAEGKKAIEDDAAPTIVVTPRSAATQSAPTQSSGTQAQPSAHVSQSSGTHAQPSAHVSSTLRSGEMELEFWRSIKDSNDPSDFEFYLKEFPQGTYAQLAGRRIARLRGTPGVDDSGTGTGAGRLERTTDGTRLHTAGLRAEVNKTVKAAGGAATMPRLAPESESKKSSFLVPAVVVVLAVGGAAAYWVMNRSPQPRLATAPTVPAVAPTPVTPEADQKGNSEAAEKARRETEAQVKLEADRKAKSEAAEKTRREAEAQAKLEADAKARRDTESRSKREADLKAQAAAELQTKRNADLKAQRDAEAKGQREAEARAQREVQARAQREAEAKAQREAQARAQREAEAKAQRDAEARAQREAEAKVKVPPEPALWDSIKSSRSAADFQKYLNAYPNGKNAGAARKRFTALESARLEEEKRAEVQRLAAEKARLEEDKRAEAKKLAGEKARLEEEKRVRAREAEAAKNKDAVKKSPAIIVPPTF